VRTNTTLLDCFSLFVYHRFSLSFRFVQMLSIDAGSVTWRIGEKLVYTWESGGLQLEKRWVSPTAALY
jgi:hypothetical protein